MLTALRRHSRIDDLHPKGPGNLLQPRNQLFVLHMKRVMIVEKWSAIRPSGEGLVIGHKRGHWSGAECSIVAKEAVVAGQIRQALLKLEGEAVEELRPRSPQEPDAQFPGWFRLCVELLRLKLQILKKMFRKRGGRAFA